ncbi:MAG TPA: LytTR family DNA-binding domain-containing protein, partial [Chitinophagaceae bacterium]
RPLVCTSKPIADYEELLSDSGFVRIHKSLLVNLLHVTEYIKGEGGIVVMSTGEKLEVSRRKKENFIAKMKHYYKY